MTAVHRPDGGPPTRLQACGSFENPILVGPAQAPGSFVPARCVIRPGAIVWWRFESAPHTVTSNPWSIGRFDSTPVTTPGQYFEVGIPADTQPGSQISYHSAGNSILTAERVCTGMCGLLSVGGSD